MPFISLICAAQEAQTPNDSPATIDLKQLLKGCKFHSVSERVVTLQWPCYQTVKQPVLLQDGTVIITDGWNLNLTIEGSLTIQGTATIQSFDSPQQPYAVTLGANREQPSTSLDGRGAHPIHIRIEKGATGVLRVVNRGESGRHGPPGRDGDAGSPGPPGRDAADHLLDCAHGAGDGATGEPGKDGHKGGEGGDAGRGGDLDLTIHGDVSAFTLNVDLRAGTPGAGGEGGAGGPGGPGGRGGHGSTFCRGGRDGPPGVNGRPGPQGSGGDRRDDGSLVLYPPDLHVIRADTSASR
jgi:hypothetical protein